MLLALLVLTLSLGSCHIEAQLSVDFYKDTCPHVETIIKEEVTRAFRTNLGIPAGIIRMNFHDCFVTGCDASILIKSTPGNSAEEDGPPNAGSLRGREVIDSAKARLDQDQQCRGVVSCADILAYAARDAVVITGGLGWDVPAGRRDGRVSRAADTFSLPPPFGNLAEITQAFANKNMSQDEMIALLGAHTIGRSHCTSFSDRLYNFNSTNQQDPTLDRSSAFKLKLQCPRGPQGNVDPDSVVSMNLTPFILDNSYFTDVQRHRVLFTSDQTLTTTEESLSEVQEYANSNRKWLQDFAAAMIKMNEIEVLTGTAGEIRLDCGVINP